MPRHTSAPTPTAIPVPHHGHGSHANEGTALTIPAAGPGTIGWLEPAALTLAALFAAAMLAWLLLPRSKTPSTAHQTGSIHRRFLPAERAYEAGTALTMALMFSAIAVHS
ncbi:DUF5134 domain-containing protein (plasmid) [Arthrobacter sp. TES]|nr:DUF5134 domain-containing protein [Arthrobacter sp. TES]